MSKRTNSSIQGQVGRTSDSDDNLGVFIEHMREMLHEIEGILGSAFPTRHFSNVALAKLLGCDKSTMTRKLSGKRRFKFGELGSLINHFQLQPLDYTFFLLPLQEFRTALKEHRIGTHAGPTGPRLRNRLLALARNDNNGGDRIGITFEWEAYKQRRGFGLSLDEPGSQAAYYSVGERARIRIRLPEQPGYLVLLSDFDNFETSVLAPSSLHPRFATLGEEIIVPAREFDAFGVKPPIGAYRLFAIWSKHPLSLPWHAHDRLIEKENIYARDPAPLNDIDLSAFVTALENERSRSLLSQQPSSVLVGVGDYFVRPCQ